MSDLSALESAFKESRAIVIVGTGLSISSSGNAPTASWFGLLEESINWAEKNVVGVTSNWTATVRGNLMAAKEDGDVSLLLSAAGLVANKIESQGDQAKANWLRDLIGDLEPKDASWPQALDRLGAPLLTTNYDSLIEKATDRPSTDWTDPQQLQRVISRQSNAVGHLHGVWNRVNSIVLSEADYQRVLASPPLQALQQAASSTRSIVYVGVGDGIDDPNFSQLLRWHRKNFPVSGVEHFRLCRTSELESLNLTHGADNITPISYGADWGDLPAFLDGLRPERGRELVGPRVELASEVLLSKVRELSIVCENVADIDNRKLQELITPPILWPLPAEQRRASQAAEVSAGSKKTTQKIPRSDPQKVASRRGVTVISGADGSGRTSALHWLLDESSNTDSTAMPLVVGRSDLHKGGRPLLTALKVKARETGVVIGRNESLPAMLVGIDDLSPFNSKICEQVIADIKTLDAPSTFITCREGYESELCKLLLDYGVEAEVHYLGEMTRADIRKLLALAEPVRSKTIEDNVVSILQQHHLPRTPFTVSLLISVLLVGKLLPANSSHTTLLDLYLNQLIGRGDIGEDSRWGMDSDLRAAVLADVAHFLVISKSGSIAEGDLINRVASFFAARGIPESAGDLIAELRRRRVLKYEGGRIAFSHRSYLYVFAAKAATKNRELRNLMLSDPLLYSPVLKHYPSLERDDKDFLENLESFFSQLDGEITSSSSLHARVTLIEAPDDLEERLEALDTTEGSAQRSEDGPKMREEVGDDLEMFPRADEEPVLFQSFEGMSAFHRYANAIDLVSTALRDSVLIADPGLKSRVLQMLLAGWGKVGSLFLEDPEMVEAVERTLLMATSTLPMKEEEREPFVKMLSDMAPVMTVAGGIASSLSTTRLLVALEDALKEPVIVNDLDAAIGTALLLLDIQPTGWVRQLEDVTKNFKDRSVMVEVIKLFCIGAYAVRLGRTDDPQRLRRLISELEASRLRFKHDRQKQFFRSTFEQHLQSAVSRNAALPTGAVDGKELEG